MSYNLVDPTTGDLTRVAGNSNIVDTAIGIDSTWSSKKINDSLVGIESALDDKADKAELNAIPLLYNQNTDILAYALTCPQAKRTLVRIHSTNATNNPFGVSTDTDFIYEISKIDSDNLWISIKAKDVRTNREFLNTKNDTIWLGWKELATMDKAESKYSEENILTPTDWNTLNTKARYYFSGGAPMTNSPEEVPFGLLEVINVGAFCRIQRYFDFNGKLYIRRWSGNNWNEWYRFDGVLV